MRWFTTEIASPCGGRNDKNSNGADCIGYQTNISHHCMTSIQVRRLRSVLPGGDLQKLGTVHRL